MTLDTMQNAKGALLLKTSHVIKMMSQPDFQQLSQHLGNTTHQIFLVPNNPTLNDV